MEFSIGDFLIFQIESGYGLMRILDIARQENGEKLWHILAYENLFPDVETAETTIATGLMVSVPHVALTNRAFESTPVSRIANMPLTNYDIKAYEEWISTNGDISDRSIRLILGLR